MNILQLLKYIDIKTLIILVMGGIMAFMLIFKNPYTKIDELQKSHDVEMERITEENKKMDIQIKHYDDIQRENALALSEKDKIIAKLNLQYEVSQKEVKELEAEILRNDVRFDEMNEDELLEWLQKFFNSHPSE